MKRVYKITYPNTGNYPRPVTFIDCISDVAGHIITTATTDVVNEKDKDFYYVDAEAVVHKKPQEDIDIILAARAQARADYEQKQADAKAQLTLNDLAGKTYAQVETYVNSNVTDLPSQIAYDIKIGKIILAMLKRMDLSD